MNKNPKNNVVCYQIKSALTGYYQRMDVSICTQFLSQFPFSESTISLSMQWSSTVTGKITPAYAETNLVNLYCSSTLCCYNYSLVTAIGLVVGIC